MFESPQGHGINVRISTEKQWRPWCLATSQREREEKDKLTTPRTEPPQDPVDRIIDWVEKHRKQLLAGLAIVVVAAFAVYFFISSERRKEEFASAGLENARAAAAAGNLALAASDLSQLIDTYGGTVAAEEAAIVLAQLRLTEGQPAAAMVELRKLLDSGPSSQFLAPAHGLMGNALEQAGNPADAAAEYLLAAEAAWYDFLSAQYLLDAGRAYMTAGDSARAVQTFERVVSEYPDSETAVEAKVRLNQLQPVGT